MKTASKLGLGTVQFGLDYAIAADETQPVPSEVRRILDIAGQGGIRLLDTANRYGNAESVIGGSLTASDNFRVVTKTPAFQQDRITRGDAAQLTEAFEISLRNLRSDGVYGLMAHWAPDLLCDGGEQLFDVLLEQKARGKAEKVGSSVYTAEHIDGLLKRYPIDIIQVPLNIFDQRLIQSGHIRELVRRGVEIHVRSAFLKGLIFAQPRTLPDHFDSIKDLLVAFRALAADEGIGPSGLALGFLLAQPEISNIVVGVTSADQLSELLSLSPVTDAIRQQCAHFAIDDPKILNPNFWPKFKT